VARFGGSERVRLLVSGLAVGGLVSRLGWTLEDLGTSANAIRMQQASLGRWAAEALPKDARIGVNDTGAIAYFSNRRTFDVCGLTTPGEARYWVAGAGSRFEHYERLGASRLPTHFVVYSNWFAIPALLGDYQTERSVPGATILGGETMVAHVASYRTLGTGARPELEVPCELLDEVDVADLESEATHGYDLLYASSSLNLVVEEDGVADGGRSERQTERFTMSILAGGRIVSRVLAAEAVLLDIFVAGVLGDTRWVRNGGFQEVAWSLPQEFFSGRHRIEIRAREGTFTALHHWSFKPCRGQ
jgi:hypothetical protein